MVELEITQAIATRLTEWAKLLGYFVVVPLAVFALILGLLGWHTFSDVEKTFSHATAEVQKAQQQAEDVKGKSESLEHTYNQLSSDLTKYSQLDQRVQSLQNQVTQIQNHFTGVANVTPGVVRKGWTPISLDFRAVSVRMAIPLGGSSTSLSNLTATRQCTGLQPSSTS
jgi:uncharacterized protein YoxC